MREKRASNITLSYGVDVDNDHRTKWLANVLFWYTT